jgi:hypothetical protein
MSTYPIVREQSRYQVYTSQFIESRNAIETAKETFSQEQIWPDQCEYIIYKISPLQKIASTIARLTHSTKKQGKKTAGHNDYSLLVSAYYFHDQVDMFIALIREYKEITDHRTVKKSKHKLIVSSLHHLDISLHDLMKELDKSMQNSRRV